ncbi:MAG: hypothetical protein JWQ98_167 [Chlorobi bacterium]|nr:hypothetical protein [Chlorobiota bacterium]
MRITLFALTMLAGSIAIGGVLAAGRSEQRENFTLKKDVAGRNWLALRNINGEVKVRGVDGLKEVKITGVKIVVDGSAADATKHLADISVDVAESADGLTVTTVQPDGQDSRDYMVNYTIEVPRDWKVTVDNTNGDVALAHIGNEVTVNVTNGSVETKDIAGNLRGEITNGDVRTDATLPEHGTCSIVTTNGRIVARLVVPPTATCQLETTNGDVSLEIPKNSSAGVSAESVAGDVNVHNLPFVTKKSSVKEKENKDVDEDDDESDDESDDDGPGTAFSGTLGSGKGKIEVSVTNGDIGLKGF